MLKSLIEAPGAKYGHPRMPRGSWAIMTMIYKEFTPPELRKKWRLPLLGRMLISKEIHDIVTCQRVAVSNYLQHESPIFGTRVGIILIKK